MSENMTSEKGLFEILDEAPEHYTDHSKHAHEHAGGLEIEECKFEFLVQDMFLDHFFP